LNLLIDTHVLIWYTANDPRLTASTRALINAPAHSDFVSIISCWEIAIKLGLGKIELNMPIEELLDLGAHGLTRLDVSPADVQAYSKLRFPHPDHRDPFDRMIAVQTQQRSATFLTADQIFDAYLPAEQIIFV